MVKGIGASPGIVVGKVLVKKEEEIEIAKKTIESSETEISNLRSAIEKSRTQIQALYDIALVKMGEEEAKIFEAHQMVLDDPEVFGQVENKINNEKINAEYAIEQVVAPFIQMFAMMEDEYLKERAADLKDVAGRVTKNLLGIDMVDFSNLDSKVVVVANDLTPSDTAAMDKEMVLGFVTEIGGRTSHSAIMARTLEIPAVVGTGNVLSQVVTGDVIAFNGDEGVIFVNPNEEKIAEFNAERVKYDAFRTRLSTLIGQESVSKDGVHVELAANIGTPEDLDSVLRNDAEGVGLYRSEFLYMDRDSLPTEEEQFEAYKKVVAGLEGKPVVIRTLDIGGDKKLDYLPLPEEMNPFLGYRAIRLCLDRDDIFRTQLRALLRASAFGNLKVMFPMISSVEELRDAKAIVEEERVKLREEGIEFDEKMEIGIMVEIPATAVIADLLAKEVDFFSIGTNDLIQYTTAVDRMNEKIAHLYNPCHPALLRLVNMVIQAGHKEGIWVGMCGEVAGDPRLIPVLLGMGLDEFSMSPISVLNARWIIAQLSQKEMKVVAETAMNLPTASEVEAYLANIVQLEN
ncbi:phosphoenolpyruvate--protein phosphotransferase [Gottschalkiaceae bacterium SANA]|nr:phosphoenolpyruvate--protein phosphotransferase [Gottschalkiaceae bacterium SANA]